MPEAFDLNAMLGLPPENPHRVSALSAHLIGGPEMRNTDIGQVGPSNPRMGPAIEDRIGQAGSMPGNLKPGWTGGSVQGSPGQNMGEVGPSAPPELRGGVFDELKPATFPLDQPAAKKQDKLPVAADDTISGGAGNDDVGVGKSRSSAPPERPKSAPASGLAAVPMHILNERRARGLILSEHGTPAQRVRGKMTLYEVEKEIKRREDQDKKALEKEEQEARQREIIETAPIDEAQKKRALTSMQVAKEFGAQAPAVLEAMGLDNRGATAAKEAKEAQNIYVQQRLTDKANAAVIQKHGANAIKIIDESWNATGLPGAISRMIPGTPAVNLEKQLNPIRALIGFDRLQQMRNESKTGGALGSIAVRELEFLQAVQGSLDIDQSPKALKHNILTITKMQDIFSRMRQLVPSLEAGDPEALDAYAALGTELGSMNADISEILATKPKVPPRPKADDATILADAQKQIAAGRDREAIARRLMEWGVKGFE